MDQAVKHAKEICPARTLLENLLVPETRVVLLAAHPDDETIGAAATLLRLRDIFMVYLTDGAPSDKKFWPADQKSHSEYVRTRRNEAEAALAIAGVPSERIFWLNARDQEAILEITPRAREFSGLLLSLTPEVVITHGYEGGHPDHDAAALLVRVVHERSRRHSEHVPHLLEMTSYHARGNDLEMGEFLNRDAQNELMIELSREEIDKKKQMMAAHRSQAEVLRNFPLGPEKLRFAPEYDFSLPPHAGKLWYELLGWPMTGERWRAFAQTAQAETSKRCA
jgi:LmbE family N-acetylglucosaminyl deacetylase